MGRDTNENKRIEELLYTLGYLQFATLAAMTLFISIIEDRYDSSDDIKEHISKVKGVSSAAFNIAAKTLEHK